MGSDAVRSVLMVAGVALGLWALFNVGGGIGAWWVLSALTGRTGLQVIVVLIALAAFVTILRRQPRRRR